MDASSASGGALVRPWRVGFVYRGGFRMRREQTCEEPPMTTSTSTSTSRIQLALNVRDVEAATRFYADMFGVPPAKQRPGYANFVVADPPLKLVLFENPGSESALNHLGVEVPSSDEVVAATRRFAEAGLAHTTAEVDACCHAVQDKAWVEAPDVPLGAWEFNTSSGQMTRPDRPPARRRPGRVARRSAATRRRAAPAAVPDA